MLVTSSRKSVNFDCVPRPCHTTACTFRSITEIEKGKKWQASMDCHEGGEEGPESDIFERLQDGSLKVTVMGKSSIFVRCDKDKGN